MIKIPLRRNPNFVGRTDILDKIECAIHEGQSAAVACVVALVGLGGMGKTQLMLQYCYEHLSEYKYVFWLNAESRGAILEEFQRIAAILHIQNGDKAANKEQ